MIPPGNLFGVIPLWVAIYVAAAIGFGLQGYALYTRFFRLILQGRKDERRFDHPVKRAWGMMLVFFGQRRVLMSVSFRWRDLAGVGHFLIFWGFISMVFSYILFIFLDSARPWVSGYILSPPGLKFFFWWLDILAVVVLAALIWAVVRRWVIRPKRLATLRSKDAALILVAIAGLMLLHLGAEAFHVAAATAGGPVYADFARNSAYSASTPIAGHIGRWIGDAGINADVANTLHGLFYWMHFLLILSFGVYIPFSKHMHMVASPLNAFFRDLNARGRLPPIKDLEQAESFGAGSPPQFTWKELMDGYACAVCGRCTFNCPASISGKPLSPMDLVVTVKDRLLEMRPELVNAKDNKEKIQKVIEKHPLFDKHFTEEWVWNCVTCGACEQECPVLVEHIDSIVDMRRHLVLDQSRMPETVQAALLSIEQRGHPWRGTKFSRTDWTKGLDVPVLSEVPGDESRAQQFDVVFWVGCTPALEERSQQTAIAMAKVLKRAGVKFAILGSEEQCNGDPARRLGNEYSFQVLAKKNIETLNSYGVKKILTTCPHCFNTMKNEYPDFGGTYEVEHYSTFVARLLQEGKLKLGKPINATVVYHDSCYLGRHNGIYDEPRDVLKSIPGVKMMEVPLRNRERGFCCGAGGGHMWVEESSGRRINHIRTEHTLETGAQLVGVSCPFCLQMFDEGLHAKNVEGKQRAKDVIELIAESADV